MNESPEDLDRLQALLDESRAASGPHAARVITPDRWLTAEQLVERLTGMCLLTLATVTRDGRPICGPVDGFFHRGSWWFGSSPDSVRFRHIHRNPAVSATHLPGEHLAVTVHGTAVPIDVFADEHAHVRSVLEGNYGPGFLEGFGDDGVAYARIDARRMLVFHMDPDEAPAADPR